MNYTIIPERKLIIEDLSGTVTFDSLVRLLEKLYNDPDYCSDMNGIADLSHAEIDMSYNQIFRFTEWLSSRPKRSTGWLAFVTNTPKNYGLTRIFTALDDTFQESVEHFDSLEEAENWIDHLYLYQKTNLCRPNMPDSVS